MTETNSSSILPCLRASVLFTMETRHVRLSRYQHRVERTRTDNNNSALR